MSFHKHGAYDRFDSINEAKNYYKRCRTRKHFILSDQAVTELKCSCCGALIAAGPRGEGVTPGYGGNRCEYLARTKTVVVYHYLCAWESLLNWVFQVQY